MPADIDNQNYWGARKIFMAALFSQTLGTGTLIQIPQQSLMKGAVGHMLLYSFIYIFIGIPLLYMEYVIAQFTGRDCIEVWKARPCLSHIAYIQILWQIVNLVVNHSFNSFVLHYILISFENPIPYYVCGHWSDKECNILFRNYTIHLDCLTLQERLPYCNNLCKTFPEYQYWRHVVLGQRNPEFYLAWRVTLASVLICFCLYFSVFRRIRSVKWILGFYVIFIIFSNLLFLIGAMLQKGIVVKFEDALDTDLTIFSENVDFPLSVTHVLFSLNIGSGIPFDLASRTSFRSPCYSNTVVVVVVTAAVTIIAVSTYALMLCPYAFKHGVNPSAVAKYPLFVTYEMIPRLLYAFESYTFWLILCFSFIAMSYLCLNTIILSNWLEVLSTRYPKIAKYPGVVALIIVIGLYITSIPILGNKGVTFLVEIKQGYNFILIFTVMIECFVFLIYYGFGRFCEDVHFMLGVQPKSFVKVSWIVSIFMLIYVSCYEFYIVFSDRNKSLGTQVGWWIMITITTSTVLVTVIRVLRGLIQKRLSDEVGLDPMWGPKSELLRRSRAMFTTHAMTKEYIYRQYHLQAGILMRQRRYQI